VAESAMGGLDVLVHAVGVNNRVPILEVEDEHWQRIIEVNLSSAFWLGRAAGRLMVKAGYGRQVYCSSISGVLAHPDHGPYAASKGGFNQLIRVMAREWASVTTTPYWFPPDGSERSGAHRIGPVPRLAAGSFRHRVRAQCGWRSNPCLSCHTPVGFPCWPRMR